MTTEDRDLTPETIDKLFIQGDRALHRGNYREATVIFEKLTRAISSNDRSYFDLQRRLVKAYKYSEQIDKAIELCRGMILSESDAIRIWGEKFLSELDPSINLFSKLETPNTPSIVSDTNLKLKSLSEFKQYCQINLLNHLKKYEHKRKQALTAIIISGLVCLFVLWIICKSWLWFISFSNPSQTTYISSIDTIKICFLSVVIFGYPWWIFYQSCIQVYGLGFKRDIIQNIINFIDDHRTLEYASQLLIEDRRRTSIAFAHSQLFQDNSQEPDFLEQEDCVRGQIGNTKLFFAEILVKNSTDDREFTVISKLEAIAFNLSNKNHWMSLPFQIVLVISKIFIYLFLLIFKFPLSLQTEEPGTQINLEKQWQSKILFRGLFFTAKFAKNFPNRTFVIPNDLQNRIPLVNYWRGELVKLEDSEFEKLFQVYGDDQVESRYILSTNLMQRLIDFNYNAKRKVYISFIEGYIYIAIKYDRNLFEPKLWQTMLSFKPLKEYFEDLQLAIGIVQDFNLDRQIWH
jgi:hypothetical protein